MNLLFHCSRRTPIGGIIKVPARARTLFSLSLSCLVTWPRWLFQRTRQRHTMGLGVVILVNGVTKAEGSSASSLSPAPALSLSLSPWALGREEKRREEQAPGQIKTRAACGTTNYLSLWRLILCLIGTIRLGLWLPGAHKTGHNHATRLNLDCMRAPSGHFFRCTGFSPILPTPRALIQYSINWPLRISWF